MSGSRWVFGASLASRPRISRTSTCSMRTRYCNGLWSATTITRAVAREPGEVSSLSPVDHADGRWRRPHARTPQWWSPAGRRGASGSRRARSARESPAAVPSWYPVMRFVRYASTASASSAARGMSCPFSIRSAATSSGRSNQTFMDSPRSLVDDDGIVLGGAQAEDLRKDLRHPAAERYAGSACDSGPRPILGGLQAAALAQGAVQDVEPWSRGELEDPIQVIPVRLSR